MASVRINAAETPEFNNIPDDSLLPVEEVPRRIQMSDVIDWFINLPWPKMASWLLVIALATQLKDFLGVCVMSCMYCVVGAGTFEALSSGL